MDQAPLKGNWTTANNSVSMEKTKIPEEEGSKIKLPQKEPASTKYHHFNDSFGTKHLRLNTR